MESQNLIPDVQLVTPLQGRNRAWATKILPVDLDWREKNPLALHWTIMLTSNVCNIQDVVSRKSMGKPGWESTSFWASMTICLWTNLMTLSAMETTSLLGMLARNFPWIPSYRRDGTSPRWLFSWSISCGNLNLTGWQSHTLFTC